MSSEHIVTQHFDDPIGSIMEIDGQCYVKISDKADIIDKYIFDGGTKMYYQSHQDFIDGKYGNMLCRPVFGTELYSIGHLTSTVVLSKGLVSTLPTDVVYDNGAYSLGHTLTKMIMYDSDNHIFPTNPEYNNNNLISLTRVTGLIICATSGFPS